MSWTCGRHLVDELSAISLVDVFNPYRDRCKTHDLANGPAIRSANLAAIIDAALASGADELWVGLELGAKGGRRTGLPLTDERNLDACGNYWNVRHLTRATSGATVKEETAKYVWQALVQQPGKVFFWNAFPFHSHQPGSITNRAHSRAEFNSVPAILPWLVDALRVRRVVALGRQAEATLDRLKISSHYVRHPGRGGGVQFLTDMQTLSGHR